MEKDKSKTKNQEELLVKNSEIMSYIRIIVLLVGVLMILFGFLDLASLSGQALDKFLISFVAGFLKIVLGGIFVLAVVYPDLIRDLLDIISGN